MLEEVIKTAFSSFKNISDFSNTKDYLPIINGAIITDLFVVLSVSLGLIKTKSLLSWYHSYGISSILADVLSITIGIIIARFLYGFIFTKFSIFYFSGLAVLVQIAHDLLFSLFFSNLKRGRSKILDTFKDYAKELGLKILLVDASMILFAIFHASYFAGLSMNANIVLFIVLLYTIPYFLYSV